MPAARNAPSVPYDKFPVMRLVLHQLREHYPHLAGKDRLEIFNNMFSAQLKEAGFKDGHLDSHDTLDSQYRESRKQKNKAKWGAITKPVSQLSDDEFDTYQTLIGIIKKIGKDLGKEMKSIGNYSDSEDSEGDGRKEAGQIGSEVKKPFKFKTAQVEHLPGGAQYEAGYVEVPKAYGGEGNAGLFLYKTDAEVRGVVGSDGENGGDGEGNGEGGGATRLSESKGKGVSRRKKAASASIIS